MARLRPGPTLTNQCPFTCHHGSRRLAPAPSHGDPCAPSAIGPHAQHFQPPPLHKRRRIWGLCDNRPTKLEVSGISRQVAKGRHCIRSPPRPCQRPTPADPCPPHTPLHPTPPSPALPTLAPHHTPPPHATLSTPPLDPHLRPDAPPPTRKPCSHAGTFLPVGAQCQRAEALGLGVRGAGCCGPLTVVLGRRPSKAAMTFGHLGNRSSAFVDSHRPPSYYSRARR